MLKRLWTNWRLLLVTDIVGALSIVLLMSNRTCVLSMPMASMSPYGELPLMREAARHWLAAPMGNAHDSILLEMESLKPWTLVRGDISVQSPLSTPRYVLFTYPDGSWLKVFRSSEERGIPR